MLKWTKGLHFQVTDISLYLTLCIWNIFCQLELLTKLKIPLLYERQIFELDLFEKIESPK